jgi:hypothetical protein
MVVVRGKAVCGRLLLQSIKWSAGWLYDNSTSQSEVVTCVFTPIAHQMDEPSLQLNNI